MRKQSAPDSRGGYSFVDATRWFTPMMPRWLRPLMRFVNLSGRGRRRPRLGVEPLEDRLTPTTVIPEWNTPPRDLVFDPGRNVLYIVTLFGEIQRYDVASQQLLPPWNVGRGLSGADISPDGKYLYVAEDGRQGLDGFFHRIDLGNGSVTDLPYPASADGVAWDIAIAANGKALATTQTQSGLYWVPLLQLDTSTNTYSTRPDAPNAQAALDGEIDTDSTIRSSPDHNLLVVSETFLTPGELFTYDSTTDTFPHSLQGGSGYGDVGIQINRNDNLIATNPGGSVVQVYDASLNLVKTLYGVEGGVGFNAAQDIMYVADDQSNKLIAYDTNTWNVDYSRFIPIDWNPQDVPRTGLLTTSSDGKFVFMTGQYGVVIFPTTNSLSFDGTASVAAAGTSFAADLSAVDPSGATLPNYTGTVHFTSTDPLAVLPPDHTFVPSDHGSKLFYFTLKTPGVQSISVTDSTDNLTGLQFFTVNPGAPDHLAFSVRPTSTPAGAAINPPVEVQLFDSSGNLATNDNSDQVTLSVASGPGAFAGSSTTTATVSAGVATFNNLVLDTAGNYTLAGTATGGITGLDSSSFTVSPLSADHLIFGAQPTSTPTGAAISPAVQVQVVDRYGNLITSDNADQVTLNVNSGLGGFSAGSTTTTTVEGGVATFSNLILGTPGSYSLGESGTGGLSGPVSKGFTVGPATPTRLAFSVQPSSTLAGDAMNPAVRVQVLDQFGNLMTGDNSDQVTLALGNNPGSTTLNGTTSVQVSGGVATFTDLAINVVGLGYTITATLTGLPLVTSTVFNIAPGAAYRLAFSAQPSDTVAGAAVSPAVKVRVFDQFGNLVTSDSSDRVTLVISSGPGGFTSFSTTTVTVSAGVATFSNLVIDSAGSYSLAESGTGGLSGPNSSSFTVSSATANRLAFSVQPSDAVAGVAISPAVTIQVLDRYGNILVGDNSDQVTLSLASGPGGFLSSSTLTATVSDGVASFSNLVLTMAGNDSLAASGTGGVTGTNSTGFIVSPAAPDHLAFLTQPTNSVAGAAIDPPLKVEILDAFGNVVTSDSSDQVTVTVAGGPGGFAAGSTTAATVTGGIASFANLALDTAGNYTLAVTATGGLTGPSSTSFTISPAAPDHLALSVPPGDAPAGAPLNSPVQVKLLDRFGNLIASDSSDPVTLTVASGPGNFASGSTATVTPNGGVATFSNLALDKAGKYTLAASAGGGISGAVSGSFTISPAPADHLAFAVQPRNTVAGTAISPAVTVQVLDPYGNLVTGDNTNEVTVTAAGGPGDFTSGSTVTAMVSGGIASFSNLVLDTAGTYSLAASIPGGISGASSGPFTISPAPADHLVFGVQPSNTVAGTAISPAVTVQVLDQFGNVLTSDNSDQISLSMAAGASLTAPVNAGTATFGHLVLDTVGTYTLAASAGEEIGGASSDSFTISPGPADHLAFGVQPTDTIIGAPISPAVTVQLLDQFGNLLSGDNSDQVSMSVAGSPGGFSGGSTVAATVSAGIASFGNLVVGTAGTGYTLQAAGSGLSPVLSSAFTVSGLTLSGGSVTEFRPLGTLVGTLGTVEPGSGHTFSYTLVSGNGSDGNTSFRISGNRLLSADAFDFLAQSSYSIRVRSSDESGQVLEQVFTVSILNDSSLERSGSKLTVLGTPGNDRFTFVPGSTQDRLTLNGRSLAADAARIKAVVFQGGGGSDSATLTAGSGASTLTLSPTGGTLTGSGYSVRLVGVGHVTATGSATALATLSGSAGSDTFIGKPALGTLNGPGYSDLVQGFKSITVTAVAGGTDTATMYDAAGSDIFTGQQGTSTLSGPSFSYTVKDFPTVSVIASKKGVDRVILFAGRGSNRFTGFTSVGTLSGAGFSILLSGLDGLDAVTLNGKAGGKNTSHLAQLAYKLHQSGVWVSS